jgi:hypothetical protein
MSIFKVSTAKQNSQVISLPERCATLVYYDDYQYTYNLSITVNPLLAVRQGALIIEYSLINENTTNQRSFNYFKNKTSLEIVTNLRKISGLVIQALKDIGKDQVTDHELNVILGHLRKEEVSDLQHDIKLAPEWIRSILRKAL